MESVACPHCKKHHFELAGAPKEVIVVMPCPECNELTVFFRRKTIALSRSILERGTFDERKEHLAHVIAEFLELGIFPKALDRGLFHALEGNDGESWQDDSDDDYLESHDVIDELIGGAAEINPITQQELDRFVRTDLKCIDSSAYFRKHFD